MVCHAHRMGRKEAYNFLKAICSGANARTGPAPLSHERLAEDDTSSVTTHAGNVTGSSFNCERWEGINAFLLV
jgi:hypothetical protein